nr:MAG: MC028L [Molluscum contagiosum virus]
MSRVARRKSKYQQLRRQRRAPCLAVPGASSASEDDAEPGPAARSQPRAYVRLPGEADSPRAALPRRDPFVAASLPADVVTRAPPPAPAPQTLSLREQLLRFATRASCAPAHELAHALAALSLPDMYRVANMSPAREYDFFVREPALAPALYSREHRFHHSNSVRLCFARAHVDVTASLGKNFTQVRLGASAVTHVRVGGADVRAHVAGAKIEVKVGGTPLTAHNHCIFVVDGQAFIPLPGEKLVLVRDDILLEAHLEPDARSEA